MIDNKNKTKEDRQGEQLIVHQIVKRFKQAKQLDTNFTQIDLSQLNICKFTQQINIIIKKYKSLQVIHLVDCGLYTLENFPNVYNLCAIDLSRNNLGDNSNIEILTKFKHLTQLIMSQNKIQKLQTIFKLKSLQKLVQIDLQGNPVSYLPQYSSLVFQNFKNIQFVNGKDKNGNKYKQENDQKQFQKSDKDQYYQDSDSDSDQFFMSSDDFDQQQQQQKNITKQKLSIKNTKQIANKNKNENNNNKQQIIKKLSSQYKKQTKKQDLKFNLKKQKQQCKKNQIMKMISSWKRNAITLKQQSDRKLIYEKKQPLNALTQTIKMYFNKFKHIKKTDRQSNLHSFYQYFKQKYCKK